MPMFQSTHDQVERRNMSEYVATSHTKGQNLELFRIFQNIYQHNFLYLNRLERSTTSGTLINTIRGKYLNNHNASQAFILINGHLRCTSVGVIFRNLIFLSSPNIFGFHKNGLAGL